MIYRISFFILFGILLTWSCAQQGEPGVPEVSDEEEILPTLELPPETILAIQAAQVAADSVMELSELEEAYTYLEMIADTFVAYRQWDSLQILNRQAYLYAYRSKDFDRGISFVGNWAEQFPASQDSLKAKVLEYQAYLAKTQGDMVLAEKLYQECVSIYERYEPTISLVNCYNNLGILYSYQGDYQLTERYYRSGIRTCQSIGDTINERRLCFNLGRHFVLLEQPEESFAWFERAQSLSPYTDGTYHRFMGDGLVNVGRYAEALDYGQTALRLRQATEEGARVSFTAIHRLLGESLQGLGEPNQAVEEFRKSLEYAREEYPPTHREIGKALFRMGYAYHQAADEARAMEYYQQALLFFLPSFSPDRLEELPPMEIMSREVWIMEILRYKGKIFQDRFERTGNLRDLEVAARHFRGAVNFIQQVKLYFSEDGAKVFYGDYSIPFIEDGVGVYESLYQQTGNETYRDTAFQLSQEANAFLLREQLQEEEALLKGGVSSDTIDLIMTGKQEIRDRKEVISAVTNEVERDSLANRLFEVIRDHQKLKEALPDQYPAYRELRYDLPPVAISDLQQAMGPEELVIKYFYGDSSIYAFGISPEAYLLEVVPLTEALSTAITDYRRTLADFDYIREQPEVAEQVFLQSARLLWQTLLDPLITQLDPNGQVKTLHLVPDGLLGHLVFDGLLVEEADSWLDTDALLVKKYALTYHYAAGLVYYERSEVPAGKGFLGFGLEYETEDAEELNLPEQDSIRNSLLNQVLRAKKMGPLRFADDEVLAVSEGIDRDIFLNEKATKSQFLASCADYPFIHLAAHSYLSDDPNTASAYLVFEPEAGTPDFQLSLQEVYGLDLQADLVVLSACQTGDGNAFPSEGVISLARGFQLAGSNAVIASQWSITDRTSMLIMDLFYEYLDTGKTKAEALQMAKLDYLEDDNLSSPAFRLPVYWAAYMVVGSNEPVELPHTFFAGRWWILGVGALLFLALLWGRRRKGP